MSATVCPFIAIASDSGRRLAGAHAAHACFAQRPAQPLELEQQERFCLTTTFPSCPAFMAWAAREAAQAVSSPHDAAVPGGTWAAAEIGDADLLSAAARGEGGDELPSAADGSIWSVAPAPNAPLTPEEEERVRVVPLHQRRALEDEVPRALIHLPRRLSSLRSFAAFILLLGVLLFALPSILKGVGGFLSGIGSEPTPVPSATLEPVASPTPTPTPEPVIYTVKSGDSLSRISQKFQVSIDVILSANPEVTNPNSLKVGQRLIIPSVLPDVVVSPSP